MSLTGRRRKQQPHCEAVIDARQGVMVPVALG
jgi:hypothetical protein